MSDRVRGSQGALAELGVTVLDVENRYNPAHRFTPWRTFLIPFVRYNRKRLARDRVAGFT